MAYFHSPTIVTSGLVLCLDAANGESFRGEPTTNLTTDTPSMNGWAGGYTLVDTNTKTFLIETRQDNATTTSAWRTFYWSVSAYVGQTITISGDVEFVSESNATFRDITIGQGNTGAFPFHINGSDAADKVVVSTKPINKIRMVWTGVINATGIVGFTQWINNVTANGGNSILRISNVQIEAKSYATPFVNGTRGTTVATGGGFGDLSGNSNNGELVNGTTYNSGNLGSLSFDGVDDTVTITNPPNNPTGSSPRTVSVWFYTEDSTWTDNVNNLFYYGSATTRQSFGIDFFTTYPNMEIWTFADDLTFSITGPKVGWHNVTATYDGNLNLKAYYNGVFSAEKTLGGVLNTGNTSINIGSRTTLSYFIGKVSNVSIYNRALSAAEVLQNYNATKGRYGL
jgi:hypothetical protein